MASYQSSTERDLKHVVGKDNPGVGQYSIGDNKAIGSSVGRGGGAPSNFVIGYSHLNPTIRRVETVIQTRLPDPEHRSKSPSNLIHCLSVVLTFQISFVPL